MDTQGHEFRAMNVVVSVCFLIQRRKDEHRFLFTFIDKKYLSHVHLTVFILLIIDLHLPVLYFLNLNETKKISFSSDNKNLE